MKGFVAVVVLSLLSSAWCWGDCLITQDKSITYDLSLLVLPSGVNAYAYTDKSNDRQWYWNVCGSVNGLFDMYGVNISVSDSAVVIFKNYTSENNFIVDGTLIEKQMYPMSDGAGVNIVYPGGDNCDQSSGQRSTLVQYFCDSSASFPTVISISTGDCTDIISMRSSVACPIYHGILPITVESSAHTGIPIIMIVGIVLVIGGILCSCIACCCYRRRRCRSQCKTACNNKKYEMQNISFQPVPQSDSSFVANPMAANLQPQQIQYLPQVMPMQQTQMPQQYPSYVYMQQRQQFYMPVQGQHQFFVQQPQQQQPQPQ